MEPQFLVHDMSNLRQFFSTRHSISSCNTHDTSRRPKIRVPIKVCLENVGKTVSRIVCCLGGRRRDRTQNDHLDLRNSTCCKTHRMQLRDRLNASPRVKYCVSFYLRSAEFIIAEAAFVSRNWLQPTDWLHIYKK